MTKQKQRPAPGIAVKAVITLSGQILLIRRRPKDVHAPGAWDIPGGRLDAGENPYTGLQREADEEAGLEISIEKPVDIQHFTRDDGQVITMIIFHCTTTRPNVRLSEEHTAFDWVLNNDERIPEWLHLAIRRIAP